MIVTKNGYGFNIGPDPVKQWRHVASHHMRTMPYVMVQHSYKTNDTYFLNRTYDLIWDEQFLTMLQGEELRYKRVLKTLFTRNLAEPPQVGWIPSMKCQIPERLWDDKAERYSATWIPEAYKLKTSAIIQLIAIDREIRELTIN